jgi:D-galactarolactone isomerase
VIVQPSTYGIDNRCTLDALVAMGPNARAVVVNDTVTDAELQRMHAMGARGIRFNLAQAGATTPEMMQPLSARVNALGWHIQINAFAAKIMEVMPLLERVSSPIVFDHLAHIPEPDRINNPLDAKVLALMDKGRTWVKLSGAYADTKVGPPTYADSSAVAGPTPRPRPSGACGVATGPIPPRRTSRTTRCSSTCSWTGSRTRRRGIACWWRTPPCSMASSRRPSQPLRP